VNHILCEWETLGCRNEIFDSRKVMLMLMLSCTKLKANLLTVECIVICKDDMVKHMLSLPILRVESKSGVWLYQNLI
jgi:hypothetical protein